jgi:hypothetical protein
MIHRENNGKKCPRDGAENLADEAYQSRYKVV